MIALLLLLPGLAAQQAVEEAFANGDPKARAEILKVGPVSIHALRKLRDRAPEKIDALIFDLKKAAGGGDAAALVPLLDEAVTVEGGEGSFPEGMDLLGNGLPLSYDPTLIGTHFDRKVTLKAGKHPRRVILETICRQTDLDYGFFYGTVLIAAPGRLWPAARALRTTALTAAESERAAQWIPLLASDRPEERDRAYAGLRSLGKGVIPLLEKAAPGLDGEGRGRCQGILRELQEPPKEATFRRPAAARQKLEGADEELRARLTQEQVSFKVADIVLDGALRLMLQPREIPFRLAPALKEVRVTLDLQNQSSWALLSVATHAYGFDFMILDGKLVIDTREEIDRRLPAGR